MKMKREQQLTDVISVLRCEACCKTASQLFTLKSFIAKVLQAFRKNLLVCFNPRG